MKKTDKYFFAMVLISFTQIMIPSTSWSVSSNYDQTLSQQQKGLRQKVQGNELNPVKQVELLDGPFARSDSPEDIQLEIFETQMKLEQVKEAKKGPLHYKLGLILRTQQDWKEASEHFKAAAKLNYNLWHSRLFLGLSRMQLGEFRNARLLLKSVVEHGDPAAKLIATYHLSLLAFADDENAEGAEYLLDLCNADKTDSVVANQYIDRGREFFKSQDRIVFHGSFTLLAQYDSDISQSTTNVIVPNSGASPAVYRTDGTLGLYLASSPVNQYQFDLNLQAGGNLNSTNKAYENIFKVVEVGVNIDPLKRSHGGFKLSGDWQDSHRDAAFITGGPPTALTSYDLTKDAVAFWGWRLSPAWQVRTNLLYRDYTLFSDSSYSGFSYIPSAAVTWSSLSQILDLDFALSYEDNHANSTEFAYNTLGLTLSAQMPLSDLWSARLTLADSPTNYSRSSTGRKDNTKYLAANFRRKIAEGFFGLIQLSYTQNESSDSSYSYNRYLGGLGVAFYY